MEDKYICDECKEVFTKTEIFTEPFPKNINLFGTYVMVMDKDKNPMMTLTKDLKEGDVALYCPKCKHPHLYGFDMVEKES